MAARKWKKKAGPKTELEKLREENEWLRMVNRQTAVLSRAQARNLRKAAADKDIWRGGLERVFGRNEFNFYHPLYFLHYLDKAGLLEFNPYDGKPIPDGTVGWCFAGYLEWE